MLNCSSDAVSACRLDSTCAAGLTHPHASMLSMACLLQSTPLCCKPAVAADAVLGSQVPGEMFALAMEARQRDAGVVGSTQNILDFIAHKLNEALDKPFAERLQVPPALQPPLMAFVSCCSASLPSMQKAASSANPSCFDACSLLLLLHSAPQQSLFGPQGTAFCSAQSHAGHRHAGSMPLG